MTFVSLNGLFREIFFAPSVSYADIFRLTRYYYPKKKPVIGFIGKEAYTATVDISVDKEEFFSKFQKNTRYEINRARRDGVEFEIENDLDRFFEYYNEFAKSKNIEFLRYDTLLKYKDHLIITKAVKDGKILSMHGHICNDEIAVMLFSASLFRNITDSKERNFIGKANRFLHYEEMVYFKKLGCKTYDFGGYAYNTDDKVKQQINYFKDSFSCVPTRRYIYTSWTLSVLVFLKSIANKLGLKTEKL